MPVEPRWWEGETRERFWLEATDRIDIGADLIAPDTNDSGADEWRYGLFREAAIGDLVFHYDGKAAAITSVSRIAGSAEPRPILWAARGTYARERGAEPKLVPGYRVALSDNRPLAQPLSLDELRRRKPEIRALLNDLSRRYRSAIYFPFEVADRPIQPNQGYAFKLPADFVAAMPELAAAAGADLLPAAAKEPHLVPPGEGTLVRRTVAEIEASTKGYAIGDLQTLRKELRGLVRRAGRSIFSERSTYDDWAFHSGGRDELQFNVGLDSFPDGRPALRTGLAFSLETSRSLPDWRVLVPRIARFNDFMRESPEALGDLAVWSFHRGLRSADRAPGPIEAELVAEGRFIFIGARQPVDAVDVHECLRLLDRLLPLYEYVQDDRGLVAPDVAPASRPAETLQLGSGVDARTTGWRTASDEARTLNIYLRHNEMQNRLKAILEAEGVTLTRMEAKVGQRSIDLVSRHGEDLWFWEVKTAGSVRQCIREAVGQLLEYAYWPGATAPARLVVVGEHAPTEESDAYLALLNERFPVPIAYFQVELAA